MIKDKISPFPGIHDQATHHCVSGSLKRIYDFNGQNLSEEMLLDLGAGVGFVYWHMKGTMPFIGGRTNTWRKGDEGLELTAGKRTGVRVQTFVTGSEKKAGAALEALLLKGQPVILQVDMGLLPYLGLPDGYHFGGHVIAAVGYNPETRTVLVADRERQLYPVTWETLAQARGSKHQPFAPKNRWHVFDFSKARHPTRGEVLEAIEEVTRGMLEPAITNLGVKGIRKAAKRMLRWKNQMDLKELQYTCFNTFIFIDAMGGTGGGIFRYMYSRFLLEAADITGMPELRGPAERLKLAGDRWQEASALLKGAYELDDPGYNIIQASGMIKEIANQEQEAWSELYDLVR